LFKWNGEHFEYWDNETIIDAGGALSGLRQLSELDATVAQCGPSPEADQKTVSDYAVSQVNKFSSKTGPDGGNLACVWTVRHLVYTALKRWITKTDGTAVFEPELRACFGAPSKEADILPGGIVISPTRSIPGSKRMNVGHVGFLGAGKGGARLIYSNSSARARLEQNFTVAAWIKRYQDTKGLSVRYYPLPLKSIPIPLVG